MRLTGHAARMGAMRYAYQNLVENLKGTHLKGKFEQLVDGRAINLNTGEEIWCKDGPISNIGNVPKF
jgi:hypothetical protein